MANRDQIRELLVKLKKQLIDLHNFPCDGFSCELIDQSPRPAERATLQKKPANDAT